MPKKTRELKPKVIGGVDFSKLKHDIKAEPKVPSMVKGRTVHIDGDFLAYMVAYDDSKSVAEMQHNCSVKIEKIRLMAGAQHAVVHLTPKGSDKGDRYDLALLSEYQGNRKDKPKPRFLHMIREWMHKEREAILHADCEADDGMSSAQYEAIAKGKRNLTVIATKDKDLCMVPGLQLDWDTGIISDTKDDYGFLKLDDSGSTKKIRGRGWAMFWAQMLMGDAADAITGLPKVVRAEFTNGKPKSVGAVGAFGIMQTVNTNKEAYVLVRDLYKEYGEAIGFVNWRDGTPVRWSAAFLSVARLLWMRMDKADPDDVITWMQEHCV